MVMVMSIMVMVVIMVIVISIMVMDMVMILVANKDGLQVMMEALALKVSSYSPAERHRQALQDLEAFFGVKGLSAGSAKVSYKRHNTRVHAAVDRLAPSTPPGSCVCHCCCYCDCCCNCNCCCNCCCDWHWLAL